MTYLIQKPDLSQAWLAAVTYLAAMTGKETNVIVSFAQVETEVQQIREIVDRFHEEQHLPAVTTVANTIFPQGLYYPALQQKAREHLYQHYEEFYRGVGRRCAGNAHGTYFYRLIAWDDERDHVNQLDRIIEKLHAEITRPRPPGPKSSMYELAVSDIGEAFAADLRVQSPADDIAIAMGFPCLSHISLTFFHNQLQLTALYRNQHFIRKAYGNFLGLARLLRFICNEAGCEPGEITCIASHADAEFSVGKRKIQTLVQQCHDVIV